MKNKLLLILGTLIFCASVFADTIVLLKNKATYIQEETFVLAEGENILGPVDLNPLCTVDMIDISVKDEDAKVIDYVFEPSSLNWKENIIGKEIIIGGDGILIKGKVIEIKDGFITLETKQGIVAVPFPKFPAKISIKKSYIDSASPKITFKIAIKNSGEKTVKFSCPIKGISWNVRYILTDGKLRGYIVIENKTAFNFSSVNIILPELKKKLENVVLSENSKKFILFTEKLKEDLPNGIVFIYKNGVFVGTGQLINGKIVN